MGASVLRREPRLLLISSDDRPRQHRTVIEAAKAAGVPLIAYTRLLKAAAASLSLAADHRATEAAIKASGLSSVFLRNGWYLENYTPKQALQTGVPLGAAGEGRVSAATRADYAAAVLTGDSHAGNIYELDSDNAFTLAKLTAEIARQDGQGGIARAR